MADGHEGAGAAEGPAPPGGVKGGRRGFLGKLDTAAQIFERVAMALLLVAMIALVFKAYSVMDSLPGTIADQLKQQGNGLSKFEGSMERQMSALTSASAAAITENGDAMAALTKRAGKTFDGVDAAVAAGRDILAHTDANMNAAGGTIPVLNGDLAEFHTTIENANTITSSLARNLPIWEGNLNVATGALALQAPPTLAHFESMTAHGDSSMAHIDETTGYLAKLGQHYYNLAMAPTSWVVKVGRGIYAGVKWFVAAIGACRVLGGC